MTHPPSILGTSLYSRASRASLRDGPRLATRQVRGRHRIMVIRETGDRRTGSITRTAHAFASRSGASGRAHDRRARVGGAWTFARRRPSTYAGLVPRG